ncbi:hypothetical protein JCGZ_05324 [Jatropha curcas]|uniref:Uncharacterized protein n=1 Tax=Jatropha curcas TaxID=180498 RepID=A0A067JLX9_JATCU|nr:hypothetical protein JCGZ_05324 [Jatropha curcas]
MEFILEGDYAEFYRISLMQPIGARLDSFQRSTHSQPPATHSSRASGPSTRTPRRRPMTDPTSSTPVEGPSRAGPNRSTGPSRAPQAISEATGPLHLDLANLRLPYSIPYYPPDGAPAFRVVSLESVDRLALPSEDITEVPVGPRRNALLSSLEGWVQGDADNEVGTDEEIVLAPWTGEAGESSAARDDSEGVAPRRRRDS